LPLRILRKDEAMLFKHIGVIDENFRYRPYCFVGIKNDRIDYIGEALPKEDYGEVYDGTGKLMLPGFYNAHSHNAMTLMRGYAEEEVLDVWLNKHIFPFEAKLDSEAIYNGAMLAAAEMLRFGVVSCTDMYFDPWANARAVLESGIKMNMGLPMTCFDENKNLNELPIYMQIMRSVDELNEEGDGRLKTDLAIHAEYTSTERTVRQISSLARKLGVNMQLHLSETKAEHEGCKARRDGRTPTRYFQDCGAFDVPATAAHCVWVEDEDMEILWSMGVTAASCPVSNLKLASGICPVSELLEREVYVALGTDGVASNNNLNMFEEMKLAAILFKASTGDATAVSAREALYACTRAGALSQGRDDCGLIKEGYKADIAVLDLRGRPYMQPCHDMLHNVVFSAQGSDVCLTMVDGKVLYKDGIYTTIDLERVIANTGRSVNKILGELNK